MKYFVLVFLLSLTLFAKTTWSPVLTPSYSMRLTAPDLTDTVQTNDLLLFDDASSFTYGPSIIGTGNISKISSNTVTLTGTSTFSGGSTITAGTLQITSQNNLSTSAVTLNGGTLRVNTGNVTLSNAIGTTANSSISTNQTTAQSTTLSGVISGSNTISISTQADTSNTGGGAAGLGVRFSNTGNTFTGPITVSTGLISKTTTSSFGTGTITLAGGGVLTDLTQTVTNAIAFGTGGGFLRSYGSATGTYSGLITGSTTMTRTDGGTISLTNTGSTFSGPIIVGGGILDVYKIAGTQAITINSGQTFRKSGTTAMVFSGVFSGSGTLNLAHTSGDVEFNQTNTTFTGLVTKTSTGTVRVQGTNPLGTGTITTSASFTLASRISAVAVTVPNAIAIGAGTTISVDGGYNTVTLSGILSGATGNINATSSGLVVISNASNTAAGVLQTQTTSNATTMLNGKWNGTATSFSAGILAGLGNITGLTTINSGGKIQGGDFNPTAATYTTTNSTGTLTLNGGLTFLAQASRLLVRTNGTNLNSLVSVAGGVITAASGLTVDLLGALNAGTYTLISNTGILPSGTVVTGTNSSGRTVSGYNWVPGVGLTVDLI